VVITKLRLTFVRRPTGYSAPKKQMTENCHLVLEVSEVKNAIGKHESMQWQLVEHDSQMDQWVKGLRRGEG
jgi:ABC-type Fe3+-citrate transport system substrate-binding protein